MAFKFQYFGLGFNILLEFFSYDFKIIETQSYLAVSDYGFILEDTEHTF